MQRQEESHPRKSGKYIDFFVLNEGMSVCFLIKFAAIKIMYFSWANTEISRSRKLKKRCKSVGDVD